MDFDSFIQLFLNEAADQKFLIERIASQFVRHLGYTTPHELAKPNNVKKLLESMELEDLKQFLEVSIIVRVLLWHFPHPGSNLYQSTFLYKPTVPSYYPTSSYDVSSSPMSSISSNSESYPAYRGSCTSYKGSNKPQVKPNSLETDLSQFINWLYDFRSQLSMKIEREKAKIVSIIYPTVSWFSMEWIGRALPGGSNMRKNKKKLKSKIIEEVLNLRLEEEQLEIIRNVLSILRPETDNGDFSYSNSYYGSSNSYSDPKRFVNDQKKTTSKTMESFMDQLNKKKPVIAQPTFVESFPTAFQTAEFLEPSPEPTPEQRAREELFKQLEFKRVQAIKEDHKNFENKLKDKKIENDWKEQIMRDEKAENDRKADLELQQKLAEQRRINDETYRKIQQEIRDYEKETQRLLNERLLNFKKCTDAFFACVYMKQLFEEKEKEWGNWLNSLRDSLKDVKTRYGLFQKIVSSLSKNELSYDVISRQELLSLHKSTLASYDLLFEACDTVKSLSFKFQKASFLNILHGKLVKVTGKLCGALEAMDLCMENHESYEFIHQGFHSLKPSEIPTTGELRKESMTTFAGSQIEKNPRVYALKSTVYVHPKKKNLQLTIPNRNEEAILKLTKIVRKTMNEQETRLVNQVMKFQYHNVKACHEILNFFDEADHFNEFRSSCLKIIRQFEKFQNVFNRSPEKLDLDPEKLEEASHALRKFSDSVASLKIPDDKEIPIDLVENQETGMDLCSKLEEIIHALMEEIVNNEAEKDSGSISEVYEQAEGLLEELKEIVQKFDIQPTKRLEQALSHQIEVMSGVNPQLDGTPSSLENALKIDNDSSEEAEGTQK